MSSRVRDVVKLGSRRSIGAFVAVAGLALAAAACGSSSGLPSAGNGSPSAAVSGFLQGLSSSTPQSACNYVVPAQNSGCVNEFTGARIQLSGLGIGNTFTNGTQALVTVTASRACLGVGPGAAVGATTTTVCFGNSNKNAGLPANSAGFPAAYQASFNTASPVVACAELNGQWFVALGPISGTGVSGASGATSSTAAGSGATGTGSGSTGATGPTGSTGGSGTT